MSRQRTTAFVPGHVTAFFSAHPAERPAAAGSRGAGLTLTDGVTVSVSAGDEVGSPSDTGSRTIDGEQGTVGAVEDVLADLNGSDVDVAVETDIPIGAGFGVSGAAALGAALAANDALDRGRSENELIRIAHEAEVSSRDRPRRRGRAGPRRRSSAPPRGGTPRHRRSPPRPARARARRRDR
jgi:Predicted archaeal kinase (sugar kinase superfamily)